MRALLATTLVFALAPACGAPPPAVRPVDCWPQTVDDYFDVTARWTREGELHSNYQEVLSVAAVFKSAEWRAAYAVKDADTRGLEGTARWQRLGKARAEATGVYEVELLVTTWDRRENDLDRGKRSVWHVVLLDDQNNEIAPLEIVKDKRPAFTVRAEFPAFGDFATAYIARFPRTRVLLGPGARDVKLRMSGARGNVQLVWTNNHTGCT